MKLLRFLLLLLLLTTAAACDLTRASLNEGTPQPQASTPDSYKDATRSQELAANPGQLKNMVRTEPLSPKPIRITPADLPQPNTRQSASKSPNVVPIPQNPTLRVPNGFTVNVFAEGLDAPRWLALTPTGDVLVTETRQNRIRLLRDTNGDGVADVRTTFAGSKNGLNIPFGMTFADGSFLLGNTDAVVTSPTPTEYSMV
jgi:glucose/arabinose dehydrogenase